MQRLACKEQKEQTALPGTLKASLRDYLPVRWGPHCLISTPPATVRFMPLTTSFRKDIPHSLASALEQVEQQETRIGTACWPGTVGNPRHCWKAFPAPLLGALRRAQPPEDLLTPSTEVKKTEYQVLSASSSPPPRLHWRQEILLMLIGQERSRGGGGRVSQQMQNQPGHVGVG